MRATDGGPGFIGRLSPHVAELGGVWADCGARSAVAPLRSVLLAVPPSSLSAAASATMEELDAMLLLEPIDLATMRAEMQGLGQTYERLGVAVHWLDTDGPPNLIFQADTFFMTAEGAILGRMAAQARAGEERLTAAKLAALGVPILATPRGDATFEGADALWLDAKTVLVGEGLRTNAAGRALVEHVLREQGVDVRTVVMPAGGVQHLMGVVCLASEALAVVRAAMAPDALYGILQEHGYDCLALEDDAEVQIGRAMNFVAVRPGEIVMPAGNPQVQARLEAAGIRCHPVPISEALKAAGGVGCLTGVIRRAAP